MPGIGFPFWSVTVARNVAVPPTMNGPGDTAVRLVTSAGDTRVTIADTVSEGLPVVAAVTVTVSCPETFAGAV
jgi:hypothetical protein